MLNKNIILILILSIIFIPKSTFKIDEHNFYNFEYNRKNINIMLSITHLRISHDMQYDLQ